MILRRKAHEATRYAVTERHDDETDPQVCEVSALENSFNGATRLTGLVGDTSGVRFRFPYYSANHDGGRVAGSDFAVDVEWPEVIEAVTRFAAHGHREARVLRAVLDGLAAGRAPELCLEEES